MSRYEPYYRQLQAAATALAVGLKVQTVARTGADGLYVAIRRRKGNFPPGKMERMLKVTYRRDGVLMLEEYVPIKNFPTDELVAKLALVI